MTVCAIQVFLLYCIVLYFEGWVCHSVDWVAWCVIHGITKGAFQLLIRLKFRHAVVWYESIHAGWIIKPRPPWEGSLQNDGRYLSVCPSVCLSVACLDLTRELKGPGSPKLAGWKPIIRVTREPIYRSKVKVTKPINAITDNAPYAGRGNYNFLKISLFLVRLLIWYRKL